MADETDQSRERETLHPTGTKHETPTFVELEDSDIEGAPAWAIAMARRDRAERREVLAALREERVARREERKLLHKIDKQQAQVLANQEMQKKDLQNFRREARERLTSHDSELEQLREVGNDHERRIKNLEVASHGSK